MTLRDIAAEMEQLERVDVEDFLASEPSYHERMEFLSRLENIRERAESAYWQVRLSV